MPRKSDSKQLRPRCPALWLLGALVLVAPPVAADEIPFYLNNAKGGGATNLTIACGGPSLRRSSQCGTPIRNDRQPQLFYSAEINLFSPAGPWTCEVRHVGACKIIEQVSFCVDAVPDHVAPVELTLNTDNSLTVKDFGRPPCSSAVAAGFLSDKNGIEDRFSFIAEAGETITVTLAPSRAGGGSGKNARLQLRDYRNRQSEVAAGALPLTVVLTPDAGLVHYVAVYHQDGDAGPPFRGEFLLTIQSNAGRARGESLVLNNVRQ